MHIYYSSVGMNCTIIVNIPPNREGRFDQDDVDRIIEWGDAIRAIYENEIPVKITPLTDGEIIYGYDIRLDSSQKPKHVVLSENANEYGERITKWSVYARFAGLYFRVGQAESAGSKTLVRLSERLTPKTDSFRIIIEESRGNPVVREMRFYG